MDLSSSSVDLASDWAIVSSVSEKRETENGAANIDEVSTENKIKVDEDDKTTHVKHVGSQVDDVLEDCDSYSHDSTSSSDIDVIDESALDEIPLKTETFLPPPILTISSSTETSTTSPEIPEAENLNDAEGRENPNQARSPFWTFAQRAADFLEHLVVNYWNREDRNRNMGHIGLFLIITVLATTTVRNTPPIKTDKDTSIRLEELEKVLKLENKNLMLEMENDKAFAALEEQMKEVKNENLKLQEYILALQKQSNAENNKEKGTQNFYKKEINELKEQVNILKFDNEELQKQLVRMRYGSYLSSKSDEGKNKENKERQENMSNEFRELKKDLHAEVSRLQKLNELIDVLTKEFHKSEKKDSSSEKEFFEKEKPNKEESSDWGWKDVKQNIKDAVNNFQKINISGLFTKYVKNKKMHLEDAFKNIGHYFKSAQKDIESHFPEDLKEQWKHDIKATLETLGGKWAKIKNEYFRMNKHSEDSATDARNNEPEFSDSFHEPADKKSNSREHNKFKAKFFKKQENFNQDESQNSEAHSGSKRSWNNEEDLKNFEATESESWLFERAAERAKHRVIEEEPSVNWYLRKNKDETHDDDLFENANDKSH